LLLAAATGPGALPAGAQQSSGHGTGTTITVTLVPPDGRPAFVFAVQLPTDQSGNVVSITCTGGATPNLNGGPGGAPECLNQRAVTSQTLELTGRMPWPSTLLLRPYVSYDKATYTAGKPFTVAAAITPTPTSGTTETEPTTTSEPAGGTTQESGGSGTSLTWLWVALVVVGLVGVGGGAWWFRRAEVVALTYDDTGRLVSSEELVTGDDVARVAYGDGPTTEGPPPTDDEERDTGGTRPDDDT